MFRARNREFFRDRAAFGWNFVFPFLLVAGFGIIFGGKDYTQYKIGLFPLSMTSGVEIVSLDGIDIPEPFKQTRYLKFIAFESRQEGLDRLKHHKIDFLLKVGQPPHQYWINNASPGGYIIEKVFRSVLVSHDKNGLARKEEIKGKEIRYIDWLFPGILGMNMMFSALWGVGYVVVRYRKNGALKRLNATPLTAFEYLSAQMVSRIFLLLFTLVVVWFGCDLVFSFAVEGSLLDIFIVFTVGCLSLTSLGLIVASRGTSEEFTTGILNFITWPMMFLSEVWFSIEGAPKWVTAAAKIFPLTHILGAVRRIMNDGAGLYDVSMEITVLLVMTLVFLAVGASLFSWNK